MKKHSFWLLLLLAVAFGLWLAFRSPRTIQPSAPHLLSDHPTSNATSGQQPVPSFTPHETELRRPPGVDDAGWKYISEVRQMLLQANKPVRFYARAIDQQGHPVVGAVVKVSLTRVDEEKLKAQNFLRLKMGEEIVKKHMELVSDTSGWLKLEGITGRFIVIENLHCEGYVWRSEGYTSFDYDRPTTSEDFKDPSKGYTFHLWKKGETERLVTVKCGVAADPYGTNWYAVNLFGGAVTDADEGDFRFWFETIKDAKGNPARQFRFVVPQGGLLVDTEPYPYRAPASGYASQLDWLYEPYGRHAKENVQDLLRKKFYVIARRGKTYAAITWHWAGDSISITGYLNPVGSRNLEPDPSKQITDPDEIRRLDEQTRQ